MATGTVNGRLVNPVTALPVSGTVTVVLVDYTDTPVIGFDAVDSEQILSAAVITPAADGHWTVQLVPTANIQLLNGSAQTLWRVTEAGGGVTDTYWINVPGTSSYWVGAIRTLLPGSVGPGPIAGLAVTNLSVAGSFTYDGYVIGTPPNDPAKFLSGDGTWRVGGGAVSSVNGHTGVVVLASTDVGAVPEAVATAKGDVLTATGSAAVARLAVGTDGQLLSADSTQSTGLKWVPAPSAPVSSVNGHTGAVTLTASDVSALAIAQNLADLANAGTARTNLGLGGAAVANIGTGAGTVAAGNDSRITGAVQSSTVTTKGDLLAATGSAALARVGVGSDGQVLTAASGQSAGVTWATPASPRDTYTAKLGLLTQPFSVEAVDDVGLGLTAGFLIMMLVRPGAVTINNLGLWLGNAGSGASGVSSMALFDETGVRLAVTGDMTTALSNGSNNGAYVEAALGSPYITADATNYYIAVLCQMSSNPTIAGAFAGGVLHIPSIKGHRDAITFGSQSSMPASVIIANGNTAGAAYWLVGS